MEHAGNDGKRPSPLQSPSDMIKSSMKNPGTLNMTSHAFDSCWQVDTSYTPVIIRK